MSKNTKNAPLGKDTPPAPPVVAAEEVAAREAAGLAAEESARAEEARLAADAAQRDADRTSAAEVVRIEADRLAAEQAARAEETRRKAAAAQLEADRITDEAPQLVLVRVLANCALGEPDDVVEIDTALAQTMTGVVDANPAAVAYAKSIKKA